MVTHSSILAWRIPWTEESGGLQSMGLQKVGHSWATKPPPLKKLRLWEVKQFPQGLPARVQARSVWHHSPYNHVLRTKEPGTQIFTACLLNSIERRKEWGGRRRAAGAPQKLKLRAMIQTPNAKQILVLTAKPFGMNSFQKHIGNLWNVTKS